MCKTMFRSIFIQMTTHYFGISQIRIHSPLPDKASLTRVFMELMTFAVYDKLHVELQFVKEANSLHGPLNKRRDLEFLLHVHTCWTTTFGL